MIFKARPEALLDNSSGTYYICIDKEGRLVYSNRSFLRIFGLSEKDYQGIAFTGMVEPDDHNSFLQVLDECRQNPGSTAYCDLCLLRNDGSNFYIRWEFSALVNESGAVEGYQSLGHDFTERKRSEIKKDITEIQFNTLLNNIDEGFMLLDRNFNLVLFNSSAVKKLKLFSGKDIETGTSYIGYVYPQNISGVKKALEDALKGKETERMVRHPDGITDIVFYFHYKPVTYGDEPGIIVTCRNITERIKAEEQLTERERYYRTLIEDSADGIVLLGEDLSIKFASNAAIKIIEYSPRQVLNQRIIKFISKDFEEKAYSVLNQIREEPGKTIKDELIVITGRGEKRWVEFTAKNMLAEKSVRAIVINFSNITSRKIADAALAESEEKYRYLFYNNPQPMWIYDLETMYFLDVNSSATQHYGYSREEFLSMKTTDIRSEEEKAILLKRMEEIRELKGFAVHERIWKHIKKNGEEIYVEVKSHRIDFAGRNAMLVSLNDVTRLVKIEQELKKSNDRFYYALKASSEAIWERDILTNEYHLNDVYAKIKSFTRERLSDIMQIAKYIHPDDIKRIGRKVNAALANPHRNSYNLEYRFLLEDGTYAYHKVNAWISRDEEGYPVKIMGSLADITEQKNYETLLFESNERFRLAGQASSDAIWDADLKKQTIYWGEGFETLFGYKLNSNPESGDSWIQNIHPEDKERVLRKHYDALNDPTAKYWSDEYRFIKADGSVAAVSDRGIIIRENGKAVRVIGAMQDVTERRRIEEQVQYEKYILKILIDHLPDYIQFRDKENRLIIANKAFLDFLNVGAEEEVIGTTPYDFYPPELAEKYVKVYEKVIQTGITEINVEEELFTPKGEKRWILSTRMPLRDKDNNILGFLAIGRDITEARALEKVLQKTRNKYTILSEASRDAIWDLDLTTNELSWSKAIETVYGYKLSNHLNYNWWISKIHPQDRNRVVQVMDRAVENKDETWQVEYRFKTNNEDYRYVIDRGYVMYDEHNKPYRLIGSMIDITERKMLEEKFARQEIKRQRQITEATILGQEKERTEIGRELHDNINQILTTTKLYLDLAINEPEIRDEILPKCYNNISNTIEELRMLSKSLVPPSLGDMGIVEAINEMINDIERTGRLKIKFQSRGVESPAMDSQLKLMVFRIVQEQINNILKHAEAETATINLNFNTNALNLSIIDNGKGFDPTQKARGIGLNNIASRAELYNGVMEINSAPGKGCTLTVTIPIN